MTRVMIDMHNQRPACTGRMPVKHVQVVLPNGQRQEWRLASAKDFDKKLGGGGLLNKCTDPQLLIVNVEHIDANQLYHVLPPGRSSNCRTNVTLWLPVDEGHRYVKRILPYVTQEVLAYFLATYSADGVRTADQPQNLAMTSINLLEDESEYWGVPSKGVAVRSAVGGHSCYKAC